MKRIKKTLLHYQKGTSNKVYNVYLIEISPSEYLVNFEYGRFGSKLKEGTKTSSPVTLERAEKLFDSLVVSKINKGYLIKEGYDSTKKEEKKERKVLALDEYEELLLQRLKQASEDGVSTVDNYSVSRLIYRAGELKLQRAKPYILELYKQEIETTNAFYYSVAWALGRLKDSSLRTTLESLREKLDDSSRYIVEEALLLLKEEQELAQIRELNFSMPFKVALKSQNLESFKIEVKLLEEMIATTYERYKNIDDWYKKEKKAVKDELMPLLQRADELYLKLYIYALVDEFSYTALSSVIKQLPITEFNFSLFRRLYKMAELRDDHEILAKLITKLESKKMACYNNWKGNSLGCSRLYFKKRSLRYLEHLARDDKEAYIAFSKQILLSLNDYDREFAPFTIEYYDYSTWRLKKKQYDAYIVHLTFMKILFGAGKRYMITPSKKMWEVANKSIKDEVRPEWHKELWDRHAMVALDILAKSSVDVVQTFAFGVIKDNPSVIEKASLEQLLPMLNLYANEPRKFFFELLKARYEKDGEEEIVKASLLSFDDEIALYALDIIADKREILYEEGLVTSVMVSSSKEIFSRLILLLKTLDKVEVIVDDIVKKLFELPLPFDNQIKSRTIELFNALAKGVTAKHIESLMQEKELNDRHILASMIIREELFSELELSLELKEKIAQYQHPEMLATTIYLLGKLGSKYLMIAHKMLINFLYHEEKMVHKEARKIIEELSSNRDNGAVLLRAIVEKSFKSVSDDVAINVTKTVENMRASYSAIEPNQLYRMLIAKSKLAVALGSVILPNYKATDFSVAQWARMAKNPNKIVRVFAYNAYKNNIELVKEAMPKSLMIFDSVWEDTRAFAIDYFKNFTLNSDEIVVIADSNYEDVQLFAKEMIERGNYNTEVLLTKLSQHPSLTIQRFVTDLMLSQMSDVQLLKMERFFNTILHSVNQNRVAKNRVMLLLKKRLENKEVAKMVARLAYHHSATMVWADKEAYVEMMAFIAENYVDIDLPLNIVEVEKREVV